MSEEDGGIRDLFEGIDDLDDFDTDAYLEAWDNASRDAAVVLIQALPDEVGRPAPEPDLTAAAESIRRAFENTERPAVYGSIARANRWDEEPLPESDEELVLWTAGALLIMEEDPDLDADEMAAIMALEFADWIGAVLGLVRRGAGDPAHLVSYIVECPELDGELEESDEDLIRWAFALVLPSWEAAGAIDADRQLTRLGAWILPRMVALAWGVPFDSADLSD
jgi:hypothetical protein